MQQVQEAVAQNQDPQKSLQEQIENLQVFNHNCVQQIAQLKIKVCHLEKETQNLENQKQIIISGCQGQLGQLESKTEQKLAAQASIYQVTISELNNQIKRLNTMIVEAEKNSEQIIREKDSTIEKQWNIIKLMGKSLQINSSIEQNQYSNSIAQSNQKKCQTSNLMITEEQNGYKVNQNQSITNDEQMLQIIEHFQAQNKHLKQEFDSFLIKNENLKKLSNHIKDQQKVIYEKNEIFANIASYVEKLKKNQQNKEQFDELFKIQELTILGRKENGLNKLFNCCDGQYEIVYCQSRKCVYHINCLYDKVIKQGQITMNNCDCDQPFPYQLLRRMNFVEAKCLLEKILEGQQIKLLTEIVKSQKLLVYKCPNLFCSFEWCFKPNSESLNTGSVSYCPNCQMIVQSEVKVE
ncbi:unnamed protein product (macronuclear) [Paramecium tetraurelia]|uniref:RING-type domain-containing protein n=1 Tax=Paramecium tetraurelia TaxID=5888 RepID=A0E4S1_PARTE|nr:uncharacterized protein GSPATT00023463001 [Paramecium tetraurelia]CAK90288.1 unnamed protein product [Paramecium tetraurelia]|eukprot:XP_001457685.1 hypothetical protein (macronuclear) [Paramecium tetraurelia strain d4-2]